MQDPKQSNTHVVIIPKLALPQAVTPVSLLNAALAIEGEENEDEDKKVAHRDIPKPKSRSEQYNLKNPRRLSLPTFERDSNSTAATKSTTHHKPNKILLK